MTVFGLKLIAIFSMLCDHLGYILFNKVSFMNVVGKLSFPIFAFLITEGYMHTKSLKLYFFRLFIFAFVSQLPFMLYLSLFRPISLTLNIFFTLFLGLLAITIFNKIESKPLSLCLVLLIILLAEIIHCDYGWFGVSIILVFDLFKENKRLMNSSVILLIAIKYIIEYIQYPNIFNCYLAIGTGLSLLFINLYTGKKGRNIKYFFYAFYPIHLLILYFINILVL